MAAKKPKMNLGPIDDKLRKLIMDAIEKNKDTAARAARRQAGRAKSMNRMGKGLSAEDRALGKQNIFRTYDRGLKGIEVNRRIKTGDDWLTAYRADKNAPITPAQRRRAEMLDAVQKKNAPKYMQRDAAMDESELLAREAKKAKRAADKKAAGGVNSKDALAKRKADAAQRRKDARPKRK